MMANMVRLIKEMIKNRLKKEVLKESYLSLKS